MTPLTELRANHIRGLLRESRARRGDSEFVIEGRHLLAAALEKAPKLILYIAVTEDWLDRHSALLETENAREIPAYVLSPKLAWRISDTQQPQGCFAVIRMPRHLPPNGDTIVALDGLQDPGNVGTIIRTAAWFRVESLLLGEGTADPFAPKVVRSTQGAFFDVNIEAGADLVKRLPELRNAGWPIFAATLEATAKPIYEIEFPKRMVLLFGTEARGIRPELLALADEQIIIPRYGEGESLNVAVSTAVVLAELRRRTP